MQRLRGERTVFLCGHRGRSQVEAKIRPQPSGQQEADEADDTEEEEDYDCAIDQAEPYLLRVVGRDERSIKNMALPAHVVCNPGHARD
ncbi:MAG: hypothetical protein WAO02_18990 [Verrucomicrobiia bacterium]